MKLGVQNTSVEARSKQKCLYHRNKGNEFCKITVYEGCDPQTCPWYLDAEGKSESLNQARQNFIKRFGFDGYGKVPYEGDGKWVNKVVEYRNKHVKEVKQSGRTEEASTESEAGNKEATDC